MKHSFNFSDYKHSPSPNCECGRSFFQKTKIRMEIFQGRMKYCSMDRRSNKVFITKYTKANFLPLVLFKYFTDISNLYYIIVLIFTGFRAYQSTEKLKIFPNVSTFIVGVFVSFFFYIFQEILINYQKHRQNKLINDRTAQIFNNKTNAWEVLKWSDVQTGNLIYLSKCEICPADVLILDSESKIFVNSVNVDGSSFSGKKNCPISTVVDKSSKIKGKIDEYRHTLSFELLYDSSNENDEKIQGYLKLMNDPKGDEISHKNIIFRESVLLYTEWLVGIVLYAGMDSHIFSNTHYRRDKKDQMEKAKPHLYLLTLMINFIMIALSVVVFLAEYRSHLPPSLQTISSISISSYYLMLYLPLMPQLVFLCLHFFRFINSLLITREIRKIDPFFTINDPLPLANGSQIEHVFLDKTAIVSQKAVKFDEFLTQEAYFTLDYQSKSRPMTRKIFGSYKMYKKQPSDKDFQDMDENATPISMWPYNFPEFKNQTFLSLKLPSIIKDEQPVPTLNDPESPTPKIRGGFLKLIYAPQDSNSNMNVFRFNSNVTQIIPQVDNKYKLFDEKNTPEDILDDKSFKNAIRDKQYGVHEGLLSILICSQMRVYREHEKFQSVKNSNWDNCYSDEINLMKLCREHEYIFMNKSKDAENHIIYLIQIKGKLMQLYVAGINDYTHERGRHSLVTYDPRNMEEGGILYVKGLAHKMTNILKVNKRKRLVEEVIAEGEKIGKQYIIYATKHLTKEELKIYMKRHGALKTNLIKKTEEQNKFFNSIECDLQHLAVISIENSLQEGVLDSIGMFQKLGFKIWLVSGDPYNRVLSTAYLSNVINPTTELWRITGCSLDEVEVSLKVVLESLQDILKKKTNEKQASFEPDSLQNPMLPNYKILHHISSSMRGSISNDKKSISVIQNICLVISGESLDLILQNPYLYYHFCFIINFCQVTVGFKIKPGHKAALIRLIRESDITKPLIMAIGNGYNDIQMLQESDFGVELRGDYNTSSLNAGDLAISNWKVLNDMVLVHSRSFAEKIEQCTYFLFYTGFFLGFTLLFMNAYCGFAGVYLFGAMSYFEFHYWANLLPLMICLFGCSFLNPSKLKNNPILYKENILRKSKSIKNLIFIAYVPGFSNSLFVVMFLAAGFEGYIMEDGSSLGVRGLGLMVFIAIVSICFLRLIYFHKQQNMIKIGSASVICLFFILFSMGMTDDSGFQEIYNSKQSSLLVIFLILANGEVNMIYDNFVTQNIFYRVYSSYMHDSKPYLPHIFGDKINLRRIIQHTFKNVSIDFALKEIVDPTINILNNTFNALTLKFGEAALEKKFGNIFDKNDIMTFRVIYSFVLLGSTVIFLLEIFGSDFSADNVIDTKNYLQLASLILYGLFGFIAFSKSFFKRTKLYLVLFYSMFIILRVSYEWWTDTLSKILNLMILASLINMLLGPINIIAMTIIINILAMIRASNYHFGTMEDTYALFCYTFLIISFGICTIIYNYTYEKLIRNEFLAKHNLEIEAEHIKNVLSLLLPKFIKDQIDHDGTNAIAEDQGQVSVLFCDIVDFDSIMEQEPKIVDFLDNIYRNFDNYCEQNGVQKIETVGKTYMACSGLRACDITLPRQIADIDQTERIIYLANDMKKYVDQKSLSEGKKMTIKIGIHYGRVIAGVIGYHKPQFSLIGDTINTASRVCSTSDCQYITISEPVYERIKGNSSFVCKEKLVEAKGKGTMRTYQMTKIKEKYDSGFRSLRSYKNKNQKTNELKELELMQNLSKITRINSDENKKVASAKFLHRQSTYRSDKIARPSLFFQKKASDKSPRNIQRGSKVSDTSPFLRVINANQPRSPTFANNFSEFAAQMRNESEMKINVNGLQLKLNEVKNDPVLNLKVDPKEISKQSSLSSKNPRLSNIEDAEISKNMLSEKHSQKSLGELRDDEEAYYFNASVMKFNTVTDETRPEEDDRIAEEVLKPNFLMLFKKRQQVLSDFLKDDINEIYRNENMISLIILLISYGAKTFAFLFWIKSYVTVFPSDNNIMISITVLRGIFIVALFGFILTRKILFKKAFKLRLYILFAIALVTNLLFVGYLEAKGFQDSSEIELMELMFIYQVMIKMSVMYLLDSLFLFLVIFIVRIICLSLMPSPYVFQNIVFFMFCCLLVMQSHSRMSKLVKNFNNLNITHYKQNQQKNLLMNLLPRHICDRILNSSQSQATQKFQKSDLTDSLSNVTLLFADIANFTKYSSSVTPEIVVAMLKNLFTEFDKICLAYGLYKVYTIGDCYVVMSLHEGTSKAHAVCEEVKNVLSMGFAMIDIIKNVRERINFKDLDMRIGVHTGDVMGGIVGTNIVRYDIYGRTVMIANKMESNGKLGKINVSETTKNILQTSFEGEYEFEEQNEIYVKSIDQNIRNFLIRKPNKILE